MSTPENNDYSIDTKARLVYFQIIKMIQERDKAVCEWHKGVYMASPDDLATDIFTVLKMNGALNKNFTEELTFL